MFNHDFTMVYTMLSEHLLPMNCVFFCLVIDATGVMPGAADRKAGERAVLLEVSLGVLGPSWESTW